MCRFTTPKGMCIRINLTLCNVACSHLSVPYHRISPIPYGTASIKNISNPSLAVQLLNCLHHSCRNHSCPTGRLLFEVNTLRFPGYTLSFYLVHNIDVSITVHFNFFFTHHWMHGSSRRHFSAKAR